MALTAINGILLAPSFVEPHLVWACGDAPVLRGRQLEIVDDRRRVRASIQVYTDDPRQQLADGTTLPDTTLLTLFDAHGNPAVQLSASDRRAILLLGGGATEGNYIPLSGANGINLVNDGGQRLIEP